ncbi:hypothetical protein A1O7_02931 [Cladophialophora yegresii CBS 114405]|uniref:Ubiquitin 3 binding protein But2 C-terminal domain-containing protein n=1 Tax=Cladophialophora yegresii CBS 114405 TaxID=1182544 RepID=W9W3H4_9EURO|nr:uncharacterized protein A1O7_02931 [Cladophialophora yegresii CBS 114405]EXJ62493.1 hypothetical protein A1O7_02931 [Cladophialophora yegresii CBS 114405]
MDFIYILLGFFISSVLAQRYIPPKLGADDTGDITKPGPCPAYLPPFPDFEFAHLAIPVSQNKPDTAYPNTLTPYVTPLDVSMIFNFDIPRSRKGQLCVLEFFFPSQSQLSTSNFEFTGAFGEYTFSLSVWGGGAKEGNTTYHNQPLQSNPHSFPRIIHINPGHAWALGSTICAPGRFAVTMSSSNSSLRWFQDWNQCPIGLFITYDPEIP